MKIFIFLIFVGISGSMAVKHTLKYFTTASSEVSNFPEFVGVGLVDDVVVGYCDTDKKTVEPKQDWGEKVFNDDPDQLQWYNTECFETLPVLLKVRISSLNQRLNQSEGVHILQRMNGCEWDEETGDVNGFNQYGYDGEDFISLDLKTKTWVAPIQQAFTTKLSWDTDKSRIKYGEYFLTQTCPEWLKKNLHYGRNSLQRTDVPSVSLLQKSPSSPVSCHATGFYPDRAVMLWRKDGEDLHEDVDQGEILPNHDGTFQMSVDLKPSSPEDWSRYDCVFQLHGLKDDIVIKLDEAVIRTNWGKTEESDKTFIIIIITVVVVVLVFICCIGGFFIYRKKKSDDRSSSVARNQEQEVDETMVLLKKAA